MKTTLLLLVIGLLSITNLKANFEDYFDIEYLNSDFMDLCFVNGNQAFLCGNLGSIVKTDDSGTILKKIQTNSKNYYPSIDAIDNTIISVGFSGIIKYSIDGGNTWNISDSITSETLRSVVLINPQIGIAFGNSGLIIKTTNSGKNWTKITSNISDNIINSVFTDNKIIVIVTSTGKIYKSNDFAESWDLIKLPVESIVPLDLSYSLDKTIYFLSDKYLLKSSNDGVTWISMLKPEGDFRKCCFLQNGKGFFYDDLLKLYYVEKDTIITKIKNLDANDLKPAIGTYFTKMAFFDSQKGILIGNNSLILNTNDGGENWELKSYLNGYRAYFFNSIYFANDSVGFVGSYYEKLYKTSNGGNSWNIVPNDSNRNNPYSIYQIYFQNENNGLLLSNADQNGMILKTLDGGRSCIREPITELKGADSPHFIKITRDTFFIFGTRWFYYNFHSYISFLDFQDNWWDFSSFDSVKITSAYSINKSNIFLTASYLDSSALPEQPDMFYKGLLIHTSNGGKKWRKIFFPNTTSLNKMMFLNDSIGFLLASNYEANKYKYGLIYKTTDGGENWNVFQSDSNANPYFLKFIQNKYGFYNNGLNLRFTTDYGESWEIIKTNKLMSINSIFSTNYDLYLTGKIGTTYPFILKFKLKDKYISVKDEEIESAVAPKVWIFKPYPNPSRNTVNFEIAWDKQYSTDNLQINIYNIFGIKIHNPKIEINCKSINTGILKWHANDITNGIYFIEVEVGGYKKAQKVMIY